MRASSREELSSAESSSYRLQNEVRPGAGKMKAGSSLVLHVFLRYRIKRGFDIPTRVEPRKVLRLLVNKTFIKRFFCFFVEYFLLWE